mmetsp:Transcript_8211/g.10681  ORF Transcript_8211/g.10681 Transcript_8211/m.10681 type:complete len:135 (-) Transcript_8211:1615-2019(-)
MRIVQHSPLHAEVEAQGKTLRFDFKLEEKQLQPLFSGSAWGTCIWGASISLSNYVEKKLLVKGLRVLEVGAGYGLCGLSAAISGAEKVILTDREPEVELLRSGKSFHSFSCAFFLDAAELLAYSYCSFYYLAFY